MIGGQPFWRDIDVPRVPAALIAAEPEAQRWLSPLTAIRLAGALLGPDENAILSHRRDPQLVRARALVVWALRALPSSPMSYPKIGRAMGRDHTSIMNLHRMAIRLRLEDELFARCCTALRLHFGLSAADHFRETPHANS